MKPEYIKFLIESVNEIFNENFSAEPVKEKVLFYTHGVQAEVVASIGLIGDWEGDIIILLTQPVALRIASTMFQDDIKELDELSLSSIAELTNFVAGRMITKLYQLKYNNDITPPEVFTEKTIQYDHAQALACRVVFNSDMGKIEFALAKKNK